MHCPSSTVAALLGGLVDDAAVFPPGNAPVPAAVEAHERHRHAAYADLVGPFVCSDRLLPELTARLDAAPPPAPLRLALVVVGGAGAVAPALTWVRRHPHLEPAAVEVAVRAEDGGLGRGASRVTAALDEALRAGPVPAYVELPLDQPGPGWDAAADALAAAGHALKLRTGGESAQAHPSPSTLAAGIDAALDRELAVKCTAGLHHAVRQTSPEGFEQHGFLNVAVATRALLDGATVAEAAHLLDRRDAAGVAADVAAWDDATATGTRRWFCSFGSCSVREPLADLVRLGLVPRTWRAPA